MSIRRFGAQKKMKDSDKYYPGSPWGDKPPEAVSTMAVPDPGTFFNQFSQNLRGQRRNYRFSIKRHDHVANLVVNVYVLNEARVIE